MPDTIEKQKQKTVRKPIRFHGAETNEEHTATWELNFFCLFLSILKAIKHEFVDHR